MPVLAAVPRRHAHFGRRAPVKQAGASASERTGPLGQAQLVGLTTAYVPARDHQKPKRDRYAPAIDAVDQCGPGRAENAEHPIERKLSPVTNATQKIAGRIFVEFSTGGTGYLHE